MHCYWYELLRAVKCSGGEKDCPQQDAVVVFACRVKAIFQEFSSLIQILESVSASRGIIWRNPLNNGYQEGTVREGWVKRINAWMAFWHCGCVQLFRTCAAVAINKVIFHAKGILLPLQFHSQQAARFIQQTQSLWGRSKLGNWFKACHLVYMVAYVIPPHPIYSRASALPVESGRRGTLA